VCKKLTAEALIPRRQAKGPTSKGSKASAGAKTATATPWLNVTSGQTFTYVRVAQCKLIELATPSIATERQEQYSTFMKLYSCPNLATLRIPDRYQNADALFGFSKDNAKGNSRNACSTAVESSPLFPGLMNDSDRLIAS
jgi:hypothetical protein